MICNLSIIKQLKVTVKNRSFLAYNVITTYNHNTHTGQLDI